MDASGRELPITGYTTTFYPNTFKLAEALPLRLDYGQQLEGFDLSLELVRKMKLRGRVTSGVSGDVLTNAGMTLTRADESGFAGISTVALPRFDRDGNFEISDVAHGSYVVRIDADRSRINARGTDFDNGGE